MFRNIENNPLNFKNQRHIVLVNTLTVRREKIVDVYGRRLGLFCCCTVIVKTIIGHLVLYE